MTLPSAPLTDLENARRFAREHKHILRYMTRSRQWLVWDGKRWRPDDTGEVQRRAKETILKFHREAAAITDPDKRARHLRWAAAAQASGRIHGMLQLAASELGIPVTPDQLDADPW